MDYIQGYSVLYVFEIIKTYIRKYVILRGKDIICRQFLCSRQIIGQKLKCEREID